MRRPRCTAYASVSTSGRSSRSTLGKRSVRQCLPDLPPGHDQAGQRSMAACRQGKGTVTAIDSCSAETDDKVTFGAWLLTQHDRSDWVGDLARTAKAGDRKSTRLNSSH